MLLTTVNPKGLCSLHDSGHTARHLAGVNTHFLGRHGLLASLPAFLLNTNY